MHRALSICSKHTLPPELNEIKTTLQKNGYPGSIIQAGMSKAATISNASKKEGSQKYLVYLKPSGVGRAFLKFQEHINAGVSRLIAAEHFG